MHAITALLATEHLNDLLREAEHERRLALVRSARPAGGGPWFTLGRRVRASLRRRWQALTESAPTTSGQRPSDVRSRRTDLDLRAGHRA